MVAKPWTNNTSKAWSWEKMDRLSGGDWMSFINLQIFGDSILAKKIKTSRIGSDYKEQPLVEDKILLMVKYTADKIIKMTELKRKSTNHFMVMIYSDWSVRSVDRKSMFSWWCIAMNRETLDNMELLLRTLVSALLFMSCRNICLITSM